MLRTGVEYRLLIYTSGRSTSDWGDIYKIIGFRVCDVSIIIRELPGGRATLRSVCMLNEKERERGMKSEQQRGGDGGVACAGLRLS